VKVLVDTSVLSLALRRRTVRPERLVDMLMRLIEDGQSVYLTGIVLQEILQGVKDRAQLARLEHILDEFPLLEPNRQTYKQAARLFSKCHSAGVQVATVDCLIASVAIDNVCHLLTGDTDFKKIAAVSKLQLLS
jgi:predicted nucleic acid-binding protein